MAAFGTENLDTILPPVVSATPPPASITPPPDQEVATIKNESNCSKAIDSSDLKHVEEGIQSPVLDQPSTSKSPLICPDYVHGICTKEINLPDLNSPAEPNVVAVPDMAAVGGSSATGVDEFDHSSTVRKRSISHSEENSCSRGNLDSNEPKAKKCKDCDSNELRYKDMKKMYEAMLRDSQKRNEQLAELNNKYERLLSVLTVVFQTRIPLPEIP